MRLTASLEGWHSSQRVAPDGAIESEQRARLPRPVVPATAEGARVLGAVYWDAVRSTTAGLVRPRTRRGVVELRALGLVLLAFDAPVTAAESGTVSCAYPIRSGLLVRRPGGTITLTQTSSPPEIRSTIRGFFPRLGARPGGPSWTGALYSQVQRRFHLAVSRRYFRRLMVRSAA